MNYSNFGDLLSDRAAVTCGGESPVDMMWSGVPSERLITATVDGCITHNGMESCYNGC